MKGWGNYYLNRYTKRNWITTDLTPGGETRIGTLIHLDRFRLRTLYENTNRNGRENRKQVVALFLHGFLGR